MKRFLAIFFVVMVPIVFTACNNGEQEASSDSPATRLNSDTASSTMLPDTMYDNVNQDSIP